MTDKAAEQVNLGEFDEIEWGDVARKLRPDITDEQFAESWAKFQSEKRRRTAQ